MVDFKLLYKRKAKKIVPIVGGCCLGVIAVFIGIALLGQRSAPLTVSLNNSGASLALSSSQKEGSPKTSFLLTKGVPGYTEIDGRSIASYEQTMEIDSEFSESVLSQDKKSTLFFKYTFFVHNTGSKNATYTLSLNVSNPSRTADNFDLANILRVRFYENVDENAHTYKTYAKATTYFDPNTGTYVEGKEHISGADTPLVDENFVSNKTILTSTTENFEPNAVKRYTFLFWLEGNDPDSNGKEEPIGSSLALGVGVDAHEADQPSEETSQEE